MRNGIRLFVALWYLLGWLAHIYLGLFSPHTYLPFGDTALLPAYTALWRGFIMPNISFFALLLAVFEIMVGVLLVSQGRWVKLGLVLSIGFNLFLVQMGLGFPAADVWQSFLANRLPNLVFILLQIPLLWGWDEYSIIDMIRRRLSRGRL
jgi:hypothetical protein